MKTQMVGTEGYIESITYYDNKYRPIQMVSENHLGGTDITSNQYDFVGNLRKTQTAHSDGSTTTTIKRRFTYDHMDRLVNTFHKLDDNPEERIAHNEYNELGELITKDLHEGEQFLDYSYNIRGWLTAINDPASTDDTHLFGMKLHYNDNPLDSRKNFNGNISAMEWSNYDANGSGYSERAYSYAYDGLNRLTDARHYQDKSSGSNAFDVQVPGYDLNGNIKRLIRKGENGSNVDNLTYTYNGNQLLKVTDSNGSEGFDNGSSGYGTDYTYDANGNMISDANKGITSIEYNHLNLPTAVTLSTVEGSGRIEYLYDAAGIKLQQKVYKDGTLEKTTDYVGEFIYEDGELQLIQHEEGRIVPKNDEWDYQYHLKDHLGNVRVTFSTEPENYTMVATMENSNESESFSNYVAESETVSGEANSGTYVSKNSNLLNDGLDLNTFLQINKRDTVKVSAYAYYNDAGSSYDLAAGLIETALFGAFSSSYAAEGSTVTQTNFDNAFGNGTLLGGRSTSTTAPPAFINYIFFDREMNYITAGFEQITMSSNGSSVQVIADNFIADQDGYLLVYLSNETDQSSELIVSWDDLEIYHGKTNVVSTQDYYPFGLAFNSYRRTASSPQNYLFNGGAELNPVTNTYETLFRGYDPAIGRFMQIDPLADFLPGINPYQFAFNNPIGYNDPTGLAPKWWIRLRATVNRIGNALKGSNAAGVAVGKHKGEVFVAQTRGGSRRGTSTSRNNTSAIASTPVGNIDKPSFDPPEIDWGGRKDPPELIAQKDFPKPTPIPPRGRDVVPGSTLEFRSNLFHGGSDEFRHPQGAKRSLADAYRSLMSNKDMRVIIRASTNLTWGRHAGTPVVRNGKALNGYNLENLLNDRARAVRDALIELGVPEDQIEIGGRPLYQDL
ncbi:MAG: RHS repeat-associated core domain-containing protein, partial [Ekhidna sp.]